MNGVLEMELDRARVAGTSQWEARKTKRAAEEATGRGARERIDSDGS